MLLSKVTVLFIVAALILEVFMPSTVTITSELFHPEISSAVVLQVPSLSTCTFWLKFLYGIDLRWFSMQVLRTLEVQKNMDLLHETFKKSLPSAYQHTNKTVEF